MPSTQAVYHPLNGREIREILKRNINDKIDMIPMLREGNAFHEATLIYSFAMTATPADCPVPTAEWEVAAITPKFDQNQEYKDIKEKQAKLIAIRIDLEKQLEEVDKFLAEMEETYEKEVVISAGRIPDEVRIEHKMPVPRLVKEETGDGGVKMVEKMIDYNQL